VFYLACDEDGDRSDDCDKDACDDGCQGGGALGGRCLDDGSCECIDADIDGDSDGDADGDADGDSDSDGDTDFDPTPGTQADVDRTAPCTEAESQAFNPQTVGDLVRMCMPNYLVWAPLVCGDVFQLDECACTDADCLPGETAKPVTMESPSGQGMVCVCMNLCAQQKDGARCDEGARKCVPIDNAAGKQVFICGGELP